jgi:hypothetical protein
MWGTCGPSSKEEANSFCCGGEKESVSKEASFSVSNAGDFAFCVERSACGEIDKAEFEERRQVPAEACHIRLRMLTLGQGASGTSGNPA